MHTLIQIVYQQDEFINDSIHWLYHEESRAMESNGILVGIKPLDVATKLIYRGGVLTEDEYPSDKRYVNNSIQYANYLYISRWYPIISDLTVETFFVPDLDDTLPDKIHSRGWEKAFIKDASKSLAYESVEKSVWPTTALEDIKTGLSQHKIKGYFTIRKYLESGSFENEKRYWVMNGKVYSSDGPIPEIVKLGASRLNSLGGAFYVIDATPELIIEVNPGEPAMRYATNTAEQFAQWIKESF